MTSWWVHQAPAATSFRSFRRNADANANPRPLGRVGHSRYVVLTLVAVLDVVADDAFLFDGVADHAAAFGGHIAAADWRIVLVDVVTDDTADKCTADGRRIAAIAFTDLIAECGANDGSDYRAFGASVSACGTDGAGNLAHLSRLIDAHKLGDRVDAQDLSPAVADIFFSRIRAIGITLGMNGGAGSEAQCQGGTEDALLLHG